MRTRINFEFNLEINFWQIAIELDFKNTRRKRTWIRMCRTRAPFCLKVFLHVTHCSGKRPVCNCICSSNDNFSFKSKPQIVHLNCSSTSLCCLWWCCLEKKMWNFPNLFHKKADLHSLLIAILYKMPPNKSHSCSWLWFVHGHYCSPFWWAYAVLKQPHWNWIIFIKKILFKSVNSFFSKENNHS